MNNEHTYERINAASLVNLAGKTECKMNVFALGIFTGKMRGDLRHKLNPKEKKC